MLAKVKDFFRRRREEKEKRLAKSLDERIETERSKLFFKRTAYGRFLKRLTGRSELGEGTRHLREMGPIGAVLSWSLKSFAGKPHVWRKRREVLKSIRMLMTERPDKFMRIVFATTRFMYENYLNRETAIFDPRFNRVIHELFGELARNSWTYKEKYSISGPIEVVGKQYFRYLIRENLLMDFKYLIKQFETPEFEEKMAGIKYALVGEVVDEFREESDFERLKFVADIFSPEGEIPLIEKFKEDKRMRNKVFQALIRLQFKGINLLKNAKERDRFYEKVCKHYGINPEDVFLYARSYYFDPSYSKIRGKFPTRETKMIEELIEQIRTVYGFKSPTERAIDLLASRFEDIAREKQRTKEPLTREPPKIIIPSEVQFRLEKRKREAESKSGK